VGRFVTLLSVDDIERSVAIEVGVEAPELRASVVAMGFVDLWQQNMFVQSEWSGENVSGCS